MPQRRKYDRASRHHQKIMLRGSELSSTVANEVPSDNGHDTQWPKVGQYNKEVDRAAEAGHEGCAKFLIQRIFSCNGRGKWFVEL
jgi:hypothetical protein